jgi:hypothetical protein
MPRSVAPPCWSCRISSTGLLGGVGLNMLSVDGKPIAELDIPDALAVGTFVAHGIPGAFVDRLSFPLAYRRHDVQDQPSGSGAGVE